MLLPNILSSVLTRTWVVSPFSGNIREPSLLLLREVIGRWIAALSPVPKMTARRVEGST